MRILERRCIKEMAGRLFSFPIVSGDSRSAFALAAAEGVPE